MDADVSHSVFIVSPDFQGKRAITPDNFKISPVGGNESGAVGTGCKGNQHVKMKIPQFLRAKTFFKQIFPSISPDSSQFFSVGVRTG